MLQKLHGVDGEAAGRGGDAGLDVVSSVRLADLEARIAELESDNTELVNQIVTLGESFHTELEATTAQCARRAEELERENADLRAKS